MEAQELNFHYYYDEESELWLLPQEMCQLGGCDTEILEFTKEEEAHKKAVELTKQGKTTKVGFPCPECYEDYLNG
ncbi:hypothetical protein [Paenibacillus illinoisensis]|uniref:hypothetical protein n=1 Tax=Paenibacillus illinoisensis TaxID=59845 RepID=UPI00301C2FF4